MASIPLDEPVITEVMRNAGIAVFEELQETSADYFLVAAVYKAMYWASRSGPPQTRRFGHAAPKED